MNPTILHAVDLLESGARDTINLLGGCLPVLAGYQGELRRGVIVTPPTPTAMLDAAIVLGICGTTTFIYLCDGRMGQRTDPIPTDDPEARPALTTVVVSEGEYPWARVTPYRIKDDGSADFEEAQTWGIPEGGRIVNDLADVLVMHGHWPTSPLSLRGLIRNLERDGHTVAIEAEPE